MSEFSDKVEELEEEIVSLRDEFEATLEELREELDDNIGEFVATAEGFWANIKLYFVRLAYAFANKVY